MRKFLLFTFTFIALLGILNCALIEPAFAYREDESACQTNDNCDRCFICNSNHHQWIDTQNLVNPSCLIPTTVISLEVKDMVLESPQGSIFRPPIIL